MTYLKLSLAIIWYLIVGILNAIMIILSSITFPLWYWVMQPVRLIVYNYEKRELTGLKSGYLESEDIRKHMEANSLVAYYPKVKYANFFTYWFFAKPLWWFMIDTGFDAGHASWAYDRYGTDDVSPNGQLPVISGSWAEIGISADSYVITDRFRHFMAVWAYAGTRNGAWNFRDYAVAWNEKQSEDILIYNSGDLPNPGNFRYGYNSHLSKQITGSKMVLFKADGKWRFIWSALIDLGNGKYIETNAGWHSSGSRRITGDFRIRPN